MPISLNPPITGVTVNILSEEEPLINLMSALFGILDHEEFEVLPDCAKLRCIDYVRDIAALRVNCNTTPVDISIAKEDK